MSTKFINTATIIEGKRVGSSTPIDDRLIYDTIADLQAIDTALPNEPYRFYEGMLVGVIDNQNIYMWVESSTGVLTSGGFTYPSSYTVAGTSYGNKTFNFVLVADYSASGASSLPATSITVADVAAHYTGVEAEAILAEIGVLISDANTAIALNTAKVGLTPTQATAVAGLSGTNTGDQDLSGLQSILTEGAFADGDKTKLDGISGANTGDQDITGIATNTAAIDLLNKTQVRITLTQAGGVYTCVDSGDASGLSPATKEYTFVIASNSASESVLLPDGSSGSYTLTAPTYFFISNEGTNNMTLTYAGSDSSVNSTAYTTIPANKQVAVKYIGSNNYEVYGTIS